MENSSYSEKKDGANQNFAFFLSFKELRDPRK